MRRSLVRGGGPKFFDYPLPFADRLKSQLLISHCYLPIKKWPAVEGDTEIKSVLRLSHEILFPGRSPDFVLAVVSRREMWRPALASNRHGRPRPRPLAAKNGAKGPGWTVQGSPLRLDQRMQSLHCGLAALDGNK